MIRGRKPIPAMLPEKPAIDVAAVQGQIEASHEAALAERQKAASEIFVFGTALGTAMTAAMIEKISATAKIQAFDSARKSKAYKHLVIPFPDGSSAVADNFDEFCRIALGQSYKVLAEESISLERLGNETYEIIKRLDLPRASVRLITAMPEDERESARHAIEGAAGQSEVAGIIHDLVDKLTKERKATQKLRGDVEAKDKALIQSKATIDKLQRAQADADDDDGESPRDAYEEARKALDAATLAAVGHAGPGMMAAISRLYDEAAEAYPGTLQMLAATSLRRVFAALTDVAYRYGIGLVSEEGEAYDEDPSDIDAARMESLRAAARAGDEEDGNVIDVE